MANQYSDGSIGIAATWLLRHVNYEGDDCLPWPFSVDGRVGRGRVGYKGRQYWAHRLMCIFAHGEPPTPQHQAAHECGKGHYGCVNPRHLSWKTNSENQLDRRRNGNMLRNRNGPRPTLNPEQLAELRRLSANMTQMGLAKRYGVSLGCVQYWLKYRERRGLGKYPNRIYTKAEDARIVQGRAAGLTYPRIAQELGRTPWSVSHRAQRLAKRC
jgi:hypothetical protein